MGGREGEREGWSEGAFLPQSVVTILIMGYSGVVGETAARRSELVGQYH